MATCTPIHRMIDCLHLRSPNKQLALPARRDLLARFGSLSCCTMFLALAFLRAVYRLKDRKGNIYWECRPFSAELALLALCRPPAAITRTNLLSLAGTRPLFY